MKKALFCVGILFVSGLHADCFYQEIKPSCSITGETYVNTCQGWSDTSSWSIPEAYPGVCRDTLEISQAKKDRIFLIVQSYFKENNYFGSIYGTDVDNDSSVLNRQGQEFIKSGLFPAIERLIAWENSQKLPNINKIATLNYIARIVGYDYYISQPQ